jgi:hypothetical protein
MSQSRKMSLVESIANIAIGYLVALTAQIIVFPLMDIPVSLSQNIVIGAIFTVVSLARSYVLRRVFNRLSARLASRYY